MNSISHKWARVGHERRNFISTSNHVLFCLSFKRDSSITDKKIQLFLTNENKRIDNSWMKIVKCIGAKAQYEKMHWNTTKTNNRCNFQYTEFSVIDLVLADRRNLSGTQPQSACSKPSRSIFVLSHNKCHYINLWICNFQFFFPHFGFPPSLGTSEHHCL